MSGEAGVHERAAVELDEVDLVGRALQGARVREGGLEELLLVADVQNGARRGSCRSWWWSSRRPEPLRRATRSGSRPTTSRAESIRQLRRSERAETGLNFWGAVVMG